MTVQWRFRQQGWLSKAAAGCTQSKGFAVLMPSWDMAGL
jgi:hypothetical protein